MSRARVVGIAIAATVLLIVMWSTGPRPAIESSGLITRTGGVCLQLEQWGVFGWVIRGQSFTETDVEEANWHTPPSTSPPCQEVDPEDREVKLPADAVPDVYRVCGLADDLGCIELRLTGP
jgi:hypothetical protein